MNQINRIQFTWHNFLLAYIVVITIVEENQEWIICSKAKETTTRKKLCVHI